MYDLSIASLVSPEGGTIHAVAGIDELVKDGDGNVLTCGVLHGDGEDDAMDCPVASRWTVMAASTFGTADEEG